MLLGLIALAMLMQEPISPQKDTKSAAEETRSFHASEAAFLISHVIFILPFNLNHFKLA